jgi:hypothetical protein
VHHDALAAARLAAMIFLLQIARAQDLKIESLPDGSFSGDTPHYFVDGQRPGFHALV